MESWEQLTQQAAQLDDERVGELLDVLVQNKAFPAIVRLLNDCRDICLNDFSSPRGQIASDHGRLAHLAGSIHAYNELRDAIILSLQRTKERRSKKGK